MMLYLGLRLKLDPYMKKGDGMAKLEKALNGDIDTLINVIYKTHLAKNPANTKSLEEFRADCNNPALALKRQKERELQKQINEAVLAYRKKQGIQPYSNIPERMIGQNLGGLGRNEANRETINKITNALATGQKKGYLLYGAVGSFKVKTLSAIGQYLVNYKHERIYYNTEEKFLSEIRSAYNGHADMNEDDLIRQICKHDSILIEEFGQANGDWSVKTIKKLIDEIWNKNKKLYLSISYEPAKLMQKWGYSETNIAPLSIINRLEEMCEFEQIEEKIMGGIRS